MKRLLATALLMLGMAATAAAQSDSIDFRVPDGVAVTMADASVEAIADHSFPTELAVNDFETAKLDRDNRVLASVLAIVLGDFGIHHFYTGDIQHGILHAVFFWTGIPAVIGIIEGVMWLADPASFPDSLF